MEVFLFVYELIENEDGSEKKWLYKLPVSFIPNVGDIVEHKQDRLLIISRKFIFHPWHEVHIVGTRI